MHARVLCLSVVLFAVVLGAREAAAGPDLVAPSVGWTLRLAPEHQLKTEALSRKSGWLKLEAIDLNVLKQSFGSFPLLPWALIIGGVLGYGGLITTAIAGPFVSLKRGGSVAWGVFAIVVGSMHIPAGILVPIILTTSSGGSVPLGLALGIGAIVAAFGAVPLALGLRNIQLAKKRKGQKKKQSAHTSALQWQITPWMAHTETKPGLQGGFMVHGTF